MPKVSVNEVEFSYEVVGEGEPLVLVHGSWVNRHTWDAVAAELARSHRVVTYDRRGHSESGGGGAAGWRGQDEDDLAGLVESLGLAPAHLAGNSFGASIVLGLAIRRADLFRSLIVHEPPLMAIVESDEEIRPVMNEFGQNIQSVLDQLESGDIDGGSRRFVEEVALGPGMWEQLPPDARATFLENALTFVDEMQDPDWATVDLQELAQFDRPVLLTEGDRSPPWFPKIVDRLADTLPHAQRQTYAGAGHVPHLTHPDQYVDTVTDFIAALVSQRAVPGRSETH